MAALLSLMSNALVAVACSISFFIIYKILTYPWNYWKKRGVPYNEPALLLGNFKDVFLGKTNIQEALQDVYSSHASAKVVGLLEFSTPSLLVRDPDILNAILVKDFNHFSDRGIAINPHLDPLDNQLFFTLMPGWKTMRTKLNPTFSSGKLRNMLGMIEECVTQLEANLEGVINVKTLMQQFTTDVIGRCVFGLNFSTLRNPESEYRKIGDEIFSDLARFNLRELAQIIHPKLVRWLHLKRLPKRVDDFFLNMLRRAKEFRATEEGGKWNDFMQLLIDVQRRECAEAKHSSDLFFTDEILAANMFIFFAAGFDTTTTASSITFYELALNPAIQDKLRACVNAAIAENISGLNYDVLQKIPYLDMIINEALRKYPPSPFTQRKCGDRYKIPGTKTVLEKDIKVYIPIYSFHHDPVHYPNPEVFDPERFSEENMRLAPKRPFLPFGSGPRICIGWKFAMLEIKCLVASVITKYKFEPCERTEIPLEIDTNSMLYRPKNGVWLQVTKIIQQ